MKNVVIAVAIGLATSVIGGYAYAQLIKTNFPFVYLAGALVAAASLAVIFYILRGKYFLLVACSIVGYFPKGQSQYVNKACRAIVRSKKVAFVGARGMDLIGETSPFAKALREAKNLSEVDVILLEPGGRHSRLRSDHLEIERKKYEAECVSVESFIGYLKVHDGMLIKKYSYTSKPLLRMIVTDGYAFVSFYKAGTQGRKLPCWQVARRSTTLFPLLERFVDNLKKEGRVVEFSSERKAEEMEHDGKHVE